MTKSRYVFFIMGLAYLGIALGSKFSAFSLNDNVLLGLSVSSCLISLGELLNGFGSYSMCKNSYYYSLFFASSYINNLIAVDAKPRTNVDVYNIKNNIDGFLANRKPTHPVEYARKKIFVSLNKISQGFFITGIVVFILIPFANLNIDLQITSRTITIIAFAFMCLNIAFNDWMQEFSNAKINFEYDKVIVIDDAYNGFTTEYYNHLQHYTAYNVNQKKAKEHVNASTNKNAQVQKTTHSPLLEKYIKEQEEKKRNTSEDICIQQK